MTVIGVLFVPRVFISHHLLLHALSSSFSDPVTTCFYCGAFKHELKISVNWIKEKRQKKTKKGKIIKKRYGKADFGSNIGEGNGGKRSEKTHRYSPNTVPSSSPIFHTSGGLLALLQLGLWRSADLFRVEAKGRKRGEWVRG